MCEYQRKSDQRQPAASVPQQQKKTVCVDNRSDREPSFPAWRKKHVWEEDVSPSSPVQLRGKKRKQQGQAQKQKPQQQKKQQLRQPGNQGRVQMLITDIYRNAHVQRSREEETWLKDIKYNGLCGGWATLHRLNPQRFAEVWTALADWDGVENIEQHMNRYCETPEMGWENYLISLADSAVGIMRELEPKAGYQMLPEEKTRELSDFEMGKLLKNPNKVKTVQVKETGAGAAVYRSIVGESFLKDKKNDPHIVHIETDLHHMSVRTRCIGGEVRIEEIVESELAGVVVRPNQSSAVFVLEHGIYLDETKADVPKPQSITLEFYNAV